MKRIVVGIIVCLLFANCNKKEENTTPKRQAYIISYEDKKLKEYKDSIERNSNKKIFITKGIYAESQLIIDKNNNLLFYQNKYFRNFCDFGQEYDTLPHFLDLHPKDIVKIPETSLNDFLIENILSKEKDRQILIIASQNDTIKNTAFLDFLENNKIPTYLIRRTTQEEDTVLYYKKNERYYYSDQIKWNKNKINFPFKSN